MRAAAGHNGGPPLEDEHVPEWGRDGIGNWFYWKAAYNKVHKNVSRDIALFRVEKAERLGLTYEEYTLEILERGRHLQEEDVERIAAIKRKRRIKDVALRTRHAVAADDSPPRASGLVEPSHPRLSADASERPQQTSDARDIGLAQHDAEADAGSV